METKYITVWTIDGEWYASRPFDNKVQAIKHSGTVVHMRAKNVQIVTVDLKVDDAEPS